MKKLVPFIVLAILSLNAPAQTELIQNGNFSNLNSNWSTSGNWYISNSFPCYHSATAYAYFGDAGGSGVNNGTGVLSQAITIPSSASSATLSFSYSISTNETSVNTPFDSIDVFFWDNIHALPRMTKLTNLDHTGSSTGCNPYASFNHTLTSFELSQLGGLPVELHFGGFTDASNTTTFRIDDVSLTYVCTTPSAPTGLTIQSTSCNTVDLSWNALSGSGITYEILKNNSGCGSPFGSSGWGPSSATSGTVNTSPGTLYYFVVTATNSCGTSANSNCVNTTTPTAPATPGSISGNPNNLCQGTTQPYAISPVSGATSYTWTVPSGGGWSSNNSTTTTLSTIVGSSSGTISVTANSGCGSSSAQTLNVNVIPVPITPIVTPTGPISICSPQSATLMVSNSGSCSGCTYDWSDGGNGATHNVNTGGSYNVQAVNLSCSGNALYTSANSNTININVLSAPSQPTISGSLSFCQGSNTSLSVANPCTGCTYNWSNGQNNTQSIFVSSANSYTVSAINNCGTVTNSVTVTQSASQPAPTINGTTSFCQNDSSILSIGNVCSGCTYAWSTGSTQQSIAVYTETTYTVTVTGACGTATSSQSITVHTPNVSVSVNGDTLQVYNAISYQWYFNTNLINNATDSIYVALQNGNYSVEITDANGCHALSNNVTITGVGINEIALSNLTVLPNPSTGNFTISFEAEKTEAVQIKIFDAIGQLIKEETPVKVSGAYAKEINIGKVIKGIYVLQLKAGEGTINKRIEIQ